MSEKQSYLVAVKNGHEPQGVANAHGLKTKKVWRRAGNGFSVEMTEKQAEQLARHPHVQRVEEDTGTVQFEAAAWDLDRITQRGPALDGLVVRRFFGEGQDQYIIDTGIRDTHELFEGRARILYDATDPAGDGFDRNGHGTWCGTKQIGKDYGVAPKSRLFSLKALNDGGYGYWDWLIACAEKLLELLELGEIVPGPVNISMGGQGVVQAANDAIAALWDAGFIPCCAAGNNGEDASTFSPASEPKCICVGASEIVQVEGEPKDYRCGFSNLGTRLDLFAPGRGVTSGWATSDSATIAINGTSMATPQVTAAAALVREEFPTLAPAEIRAKLKEYASQGAVHDADSPMRDVLFVLFNAPVMAPDVPTDPPPPVVDFTVQQDGAWNQVLLTAIEQGQIVDRIWNFGDGQVSGHGATSTAVHSYQAPGTYFATLDVLDVERQPATAQRAVTLVDPTDPPDPPDPTPEPPVVPEATYTVVAQKGIKILRMVWKGLRGDQVELYLDGRKVSLLLNNGVAQYNTGLKKPPQSVRVCEVGGTVCATAVQV